MNKLISVTFLVSLVISLLRLATPSSAIASHILFQDDFSGDLNSWNEVSPWGSWFTNPDENYEGEITRFSLPERPSYTIAGNSNWSDYSYEVKVRGVIGVDKVILFRITNSNTSYLLNLRTNYSLGSTMVPSSVLLGKRTVLGTPNAVLLASQNYTIQNNIWYSVKIDLNGNNIKIYIDNNLVINFNDPSPILSGSIGLEMWPGSYAIPATNLPTRNQFDDVKVIDPNGNTNHFGPLNLPFDYPNRTAGNSEENFISVLQDRARSYFDHEFAQNSFVLYDGSESLANCDSAENPPATECYDSHNAMDFTSTKGERVLSAGTGEVIYASDVTIGVDPVTGTTKESCVQEKTGLGCIVIIKHEEDLYSMYAHLKDVDLTEADLVDETSLVGKMGNTGCYDQKVGRGCKAHLHFAVMAPKNLALAQTKIMTNGDWKSIFEQFSTEEDSKEKKFPYKNYKPFCSVTAGNGLSFIFKDPNGWSGEGIDPWSKPKSEGGCEVESEYLWKYPEI